MENSPRCWRSCCAGFAAEEAVSAGWGSAPGNRINCPLAQKARVESGWLDHPNHSTALRLWTTGAAQIQGGQQACGDPKAPFVMILQ